MALTRITSNEYTGNIVLPDSTSFGTANSLGMRNRIINGGMQVWQRGTSFTFGNGANTFIADRWWGVCNTASGQTVSQSTDVPTNQFQYSLKMQRPNGNTGTANLNITQIIETINCYDLAGQSVTLSFWAKTGANYSGGALSVYLQSGTTADQGNSVYFSWAGRAFPIASTTTLSTTWTKYTFSGTVSSSSLELGVQLAFTPAGTAGADDSVYVTGVQLEVGSVATPFERRLYGQELALCQRYYYRITAQSSGDYFVPTAFAISTTQAFGFTIFPVQMRVKPTALDQSGTASDYNIVRCGGGTNITCSSVPTFGIANLNNAETVFTVASGLVNGGAGAIQSMNTNAYLGWSAEL